MSNKNREVIRVLWTEGEYREVRERGYDVYSVGRCRTDCVGVQKWIRSSGSWNERYISEIDTCCVLYRYIPVHIHLPIYPMSDERANTKIHRSMTETGCEWVVSNTRSDYCECVEMIVGGCKLVEWRLSVQRSTPQRIDLCVASTHWFVPSTTQTQSSQLKKEFDTWAICVGSRSVQCFASRCCECRSLSSEGVAPIAGPTAHNGLRGEPHKWFRQINRGCGESHRLNRGGGRNL